MISVDVLEARHGARFPTGYVVVLGEEWEVSVDAFLVEALSLDPFGDADLDRAVRLLWSVEMHRLFPEMYDLGTDVLERLRSAFAAVSDPVARRVALVAHEWVARNDPQISLFEGVREALGEHRPPWWEAESLRLRLLDAPTAAAAKELLHELGPEDLRRCDVLRRAAELEDREGGEGAGELTRIEADVHEQRFDGEVGRVRVLARNAKAGLLRKEPERGRRILEETLEVAGRYPERVGSEDLAALHYGLAYVAAVQDDSAAARRHLEQALGAVSPQDLGMPLKISRAFAVVASGDGDPEEEIRWLHRALEHTRDYTSFSLQLTLEAAYRGAGQDQDAESAYTNALSLLDGMLSADRVLALDHLAERAALKNDLDEAFAFGKESLWQRTTARSAKYCWMAHVTRLPAVLARRCKEELLRFEIARTGHGTLRTLEELSDIVGSEYHDSSAVLGYLRDAVKLVPESERDYVQMRLEELPDVWRPGRPYDSWQPYYQMWRLIESLAEPGT